MSVASDFDKAINRAVKIERAAQALIDDVKQRYPGEKLRCKYMRALDRALER